MPYVDFGAKQNGVSVDTGSAYTAMNATTGTILILWYPKQTDQQFCRLWHAKTGGFRNQVSLSASGQTTVFGWSYSGGGSTDLSLTTSSGTAWTNNAWGWIAMVDNGAGNAPQAFSAGLDGVFTEDTSASTTTPAGTRDAPDAALDLGNTDGNNRGAAARIACVMNFNEAITDLKELQRLALDPRAEPNRRGTCVGLWFPGEQGSSGTVPDMSGAGWDGTWVGTPSLADGPGMVLRRRATGQHWYPGVAGGVTITGTGAITLGAMTLAGTGEIERTATGAITTAAMQVAGSGSMARDGTGAITLAAQTVAGTAEREIPGSGAITTAAMTVAGTGTTGKEGSGAITLGAQTVAGAGEREVTASGAITNPAQTVAGSGSMARDGTGAITLGGQAVAGTAEREVTGSGAITHAAMTVSGTGSLGAVTSGTGAITLGAMTVAGSGTREVTSSGAITTGAMILAAVGLRTVTATAAFSLAAMTVAGTAERTLTGSGAITLAAMTVSGTQAALSALRTSTALTSLNRVTFASGRNRSTFASGRNRVVFTPKGNRS